MIKITKGFIAFKNPEYKYYARVTNIQLGERNVVTIAYKHVPKSLEVLRQEILEVLEKSKDDIKYRYGSEAYNIDNFKVEFIEAK
jgi:sRNA-binding carbon storage regulator CsrA